MGDSYCYSCRKYFRNSGMIRHLKSCLIKNEGYKIAENSRDSCYLVRVQAQYEKDYSLYLMVDSCVLLQELDQYLRDIWLECCNHLSHFKINGESFERYTESSREQNMEEEIGTLFYPGLTCTYEYDYGSTTYLLISVEEAYKPNGDKKGIRLLARNKPVEYECEQCEKIAEVQYFNPNDGECGIVCSSCKQKMEQEDDEIDFSECINSPRAGVCAYEGPSYDISFLPHTPLKQQKKSKKTEIIEIPDSNKESNKMLEFLDSIMTGNANIEATEVRQMVENTIKRFLNTKKEDPFVLEYRKVAEKSFAYCLMLLKKSELDIIRASLAITNASNIKKQELAQCIENHIRQNFYDILIYMSSDDFRLLQEISKEDPYFYDDADEGTLEAIRYLLRKGLIFVLRYPMEKIELFFPFRADFLQITADSEFMRKRDLTKQMEKCIDSIFFYWGIAELEKVMAETARLLKVPADEKFAYDFHRIISYMDSGTLKYELIGNTPYYYIYSRYPAEQIISNLWQQSDYLPLSMEMIPEECGLIGLILNHLHFRLLYEFFYDLAKEEMSKDLDDECDEADEDSYREKAFTTTACLIENILNAKPDISPEQFLKETELPDHFWKQQDTKQFFIDMKNHAPNYWMKGNSISGKTHFVGTNFEQLQNSQDKPDKKGNNSVNAVVNRWNVGRNDPCPCGSGKKYKKCCLDKTSKTGDKTGDGT